MNIYFAATQPATSAEGAVYERFASHDLLDMWKSPLDPRLGLVYGVLARFSTRTAGVSELTIRIPAILGGLLFWFGLASFCRKLDGWPALFAFLLIAANPWTYRAFSSANGAALAAGLILTALRIVRRRPENASLLMGLAIGSDAVVAGAGMAAFAIGVAILRRDAWKWIDECLLPGLVLGLFVLLPALLVRDRPIAVSHDDLGMRQLVRNIQHSDAAVPVAPSPQLEPGLFFYRRRYHLDWIHIVRPGEPAAYFLLPESERSTAEKRGLRVLQTAPGILLAETSPPGPASKD